MLLFCLLLIPPAEPETDSVEVLIVNHVYSDDDEKLRLVFTQYGGLDREGRWQWWRIPTTPVIEETEERRITFSDKGILRRIRYRSVIRKPSIGDLELQDRERLSVDKRKGLGGQ